MPRAHRPASPQQTSQSRRRVESFPLLNMSPARVAPDSSPAFVRASTPAPAAVSQEVDRHNISRIALEPRPPQICVNDLLAPKTAHDPTYAQKSSQRQLRKRPAFRLL